MPDFTNVEAVKLDAKRRVYADMCRLYALQVAPGDDLGYRMVHIPGSPDGRIKKNWFVDDQGFLNAATFHLADVPPMTDEIFQRINAFGYVRHVRLYPTPWIYVLSNTGIEIEVLGSQRVIKYHCLKTNDKILRQVK